MKRLLTILVALAVVSFAKADEKSDTMLAALAQKIAGWGDYRVEFSVTIDEQSLAGSYEVSGAKYHVTTPDMELFCDGVIKWEVNHPDREVAIDAVDPGDRTVMGNPTRLFDFLDGSYIHRYVGPALIDGVSCERIELTETTPATSGSGTSDGSSGTAQKIDVFLSAKTGLPVRIGYAIGFMSTDATVDVVRITPRITLDKASFGYDPKRYSGYEIIDFR